MIHLEIQETSAGQMAWDSGPDPLRVRGLNTQNLEKKQRHMLLCFGFFLGMSLLIAELR